jgi:hypothetical protein
MSDELWSIELGKGLGVIELGATREEAARRLKEHKIELDLEDEDDWLWVEEMNAELHFTTAEPRVVNEITVEDEQVRLGPMEVIGKRLHEIVGFLQVVDSETVWRPWDDDEGAVEPGKTFEPQTDEELLDGGTLWIPALGLGLSMLRGDIDTVRLRKPEDTPRTGVGALTPAQRELSARENLRDILVRPRNPLARPVSWLQTLLGFGLAAALALVFWRAVDYQRQWNDAPTVEGEVIAVEPPPPEPFPRKFTITYRDQAGGEHTTVFERADIYVNAVGEKVDVRYLPEAPDQPMGPARVRDAAFIKFGPWGIGVLAVYFVLQVVLSVVGWVLQGMKPKRALGGRERL